MTLASRRRRCQNGAVRIVGIQILFVACTLLALAVSSVDADPKSPRREPWSAMQIAEGLLSRDGGRIERASTELDLCTEETGKAFGKEIQSHGIREAQVLLRAVGRAQTRHALIAAIVALESEHVQVQVAAFDAMLDAPLESVKESGDKHLTGRRRANLLAQVTTAERLAPVCDGLSSQKATLVDSELEEALRICIVADRYFGAAGFLGLLRGLAQIMLGERVRELPADKDADQDADKDGVKEAGDSEKKKLESEVRRRQGDRRRRAAAKMFRAVWVADLSEFNYQSTAKWESRNKSVGRIRKRLLELERVTVRLGDTEYLGTRYGDHLMGLFGTDVSEDRAAAFQRLRALSGQDTPVTGEDYAEAVDKLNAMSHRHRRKLRRELRTWWAGYRARTETNN